MDTVSFHTSAEDRAILIAILKRAKTVANEIGSPLRDPLSLHMDLTACHANGCPLKLKELLETDDFNFTHDVFGISRHLDRGTGKLTQCFLPRFAARTQEAA
ncbi:hypothetical protein [Variovorax sp. 278MFTsu5.1]|uniref:DUF6874 family protein n=1 Tax=Variovorax sp. 278MFTsu5.1 TaxID=3158366 RepID=UPI003AAAA609